jgi:hypothetical protein
MCKVPASFSFAFVRLRHGSFLLSPRFARGNVMRQGLSTCIFYFVIQSHTFPEQLIKQGVEIFQQNQTHEIKCPVGNLLKKIQFDIPMSTKDIAA